MMPYEYYVFFAFILFITGLIGVLLRRNLLMILMCIELMLNAANLLFVTGGHLHGGFEGSIAVCFIVTIAACEASIGLAMIIAIFRRWGTIDTGFLKTLRG